MAKQLSRTRNKKGELRRFRNAELASFLVNTLNGSQGGGVNVSRIADIIERLKGLQGYFRAHPLGVRFDDPELERQFEAVNDCLWNYRAVPALLPDSPLVIPLIRGWSLRWFSAANLSYPDLELMAVLHAIDLAEKNQIQSLKLCGNTNCKRWLFARFTHQRFCSEKCKDEFHHTDPGEKQRRREWQKANYLSRKELELGSRNAAQRKGGKR